MKGLRIVFIALMTSLLLAGSASAHVQMDYPAGGETFVTGETVTIQWSLIIAHQEQTDWDLFYTPDGGATWEVIQLDLPVSQETYEWTVPQQVSEKVRVRVVQDGAGWDSISSFFAIQGSITSVQKREKYPNTFALSNFPNPFNPATTIQFSLPEAGFVSLVVYDIAGQKVREIVSGEKISGLHSVIWNGTNEFGHNVSSGIYLYRLQAGEFTKTQAMTLVR